MHSDAFMYVPHCQFVAGSWHSHNFIRTGRIHVPVHATLGNSIDEVTIDYTKPWQRKHIRSIEMTYGKFRYFQDYWYKIKPFIENKAPNLAVLNMRLMETLLDLLGCSTPVHISSFVSGDSIDKLVAICKSVNCDTYLSNEGARAYIHEAEEARMAHAGITHRWFRFRDPDYGQPRTVNDGRLSVLDALFTLGPAARGTILNAGGVAQ